MRFDSIRLRRAGGWLAVAATLVACALAAATAEGAPKPTAESYPALQKQVAAGQVKKATVSPQKHTVKVKLANGRTYSATFTAAEQATLVSSLKAKGAKVHLDKKPKKSSHLRYRYIALIVLGAIAIAGLIYLMLRRRPRDGRHEPTVISPGPSASPPKT